MASCDILALDEPCPQCICVNVGRAWSSRQGSQGAYRTFPREAKGLEVHPTQLIPEPSPQCTLSSEKVQTQ